MTSFQNGDHRAFEILYHRYKSRIFSFLLRQHQASNDAAKELTQEVFIRVAHSGGGFRHGSRFSTWLYTIARNISIDAMRKARHRKHASLDQPNNENGTSLGEHIPDNGPSPDKASTRTQLRHDITHAISRLPEDQREVFLLREYHGLPFKEIANIVDAKEGTVKSRMRYAVETLKKALENYVDYARTLP